MCFDPDARECLRHLWSFVRLMWTVQRPMHHLRLTSQHCCNLIAAIVAAAMQTNCSPQITTARISFAWTFIKFVVDAPKGSCQQVPKKFFLVTNSTKTIGCCLMHLKMKLAWLFKNMQWFCMHHPKILHASWGKWRTKHAIVCCSSLHPPHRSVGNKRICFSSNSKFDSIDVIPDAHTTKKMSLVSCCTAAITFTISR